MKQFVKFFPLLALVAISLAKTAMVDAATGMNPPVKLVWHYYKDTCDDAETYIRYQVEKFYRNDSTIAPKLLRLLYSDCMVNVSIKTPLFLIYFSFSTKHQHYFNLLLIPYGFCFM